MKQLAKYPFHPFLFAAYPILYLLSFNIAQIPMEEVTRPLLISLSVTLFLTVLFGVSARDFRQGGLSASIIVLLFFSYGHVFRWFATNAKALASHAILGGVWLLLLVLGLAFKYRIRDIGGVTKYLNIISIVLLIQPIFNIGLFAAQSKQVTNVAPPSPFENVKPNPQANTNLPDIYYIILDAYSRSDVTQELFQYDNSSFIEFLEGRGFYVASQSRSNYVQTALSISSSLNLDYLNITDQQAIQSGDRDPLAELIHHSELRSFLEAQGYQTVTFATAYGPTNITDADVFIPYRVKLVSNLEGLILSSSATAALGDHMQNLLLPLQCDVQRGGILNIVENIKKVPALPGPKFVFAHIPAPHPPFVFAADGESTQHGDCNGLDGSLFNGSRKDYQAGYPQQMAYISKVMQEVVSVILNESQVPPVIIIQGDHGSGMLLDWNSSENSCLRERTAILNAYYIPGGASALYDAITPVNSFRVILDTVFDAHLPLLEDKSYYSTWDEPYRVEDITNKIEPACKTP